MNLKTNEEIIENLKTIFSAHGISKETIEKSIKELIPLLNSDSIRKILSSDIFYKHLNSTRLSYGTLSAKEIHFSFPHNNTLSITSEFPTIKSSVNEKFNLSNESQYYFYGSFFAETVNHYIKIDNTNECTVYDKFQMSCFDSNGKEITKVINHNKKNNIPLGDINFHTANKSFKGFFKRNGCFNISYGTTIILNRNNKEAPECLERIEYKNGYIEKSDLYFIPSECELITEDSIIPAYENYKYRKIKN